MKEVKIYDQKYYMVFFLLIICHSYKVIDKQIIKKKLKKNVPFKIKKIATGIKINELNILFSNSLSIIFSQNYV